MGVQPCSWCFVADLEEFAPATTVRTQLEVHAHIRQIRPLEREDIPKILLVGWDIECDSSHGDMPQAIKSFDRAARELIQWVRRSLRVPLPADVAAEFAEALRGVKTDHFSAM